MSHTEFARTSITSPKAPTPVGPYVHAVKLDRPNTMLFVSGQIPLDTATGTIVEGGTAAQAKCALTQLKNIVEEAGLAMNDVVKCTIFMTDLNDSSIVNEIYGQFFTGPHYPARAAVQVSRLPKDVNVEIEAIAIKG